MIFPKGNYFFVDEKIFEKYISDDVKIESFEKLGEENLLNGKKWYNYRLGDHFRGRETNPLNFPNTLMYDFNASIKKKKNKFDVLFDIIKTREIYNFDSSKFLIVGLRIGDIFVNRNHKLNSYLFLAEEFRKIDLQKELNKTVIFCCGAHMRPNIQKTKKYLLEIYDEFKQKGFQEIIFRIGNSPDDDFVLMSNATNFIPGKGNYHKLIKEMNMKYKNTNIYNIETD